LSPILVGHPCRVQPGRLSSTKIVDQDERPSFVSSGNSFFVANPGRPTLSSPTWRGVIDKDCRRRRATKICEFWIVPSLSPIFVGQLCRVRPERCRRQRLSTKTRDQVL